MMSMSSSRAMMRSGTAARLLLLSRRSSSSSRIVSRLLQNSKFQCRTVVLAFPQQHCRHFSRKTRDDFWVDPSDDPDVVVDDDDIPGVSGERREYTANEMEFFDEEEDEKDDYEDVVRERHEEEERMEQAQQVRDELDAKTGRLWSDPWEITDEDWSSKRTYEDLPDWTPDMCSRISMERVQVHADGILTLKALAQLPLPPPPPPHPGHGGSPAPYASYRKQYLSRHVYDQVVALAEPHVQDILKTADWNEKQDKVDELFESVESELKQEQDTVLGKQPQFGAMVESALERYLQSVERTERDKKVALLMNSIKEIAEKEVQGIVEKTTWKEKRQELDDLSKTLETQLAERQVDLAKHPQFGTLLKGALKKYMKELWEADAGEEESGDIVETLSSDDETALPVFMDLYDSDNDSPDAVVPKILHPLEPHPKDGPGRMVEEWELAAHKKTKRIMLRQCTRQIARILQDESSSSRIVVTGRQGVGKTAAMNAIVASARKSGYIVLFLPDGDRMKRNFYYVEPNARREGMFDLPVLSQEVCGQFLSSHESNLEGIYVNSDTLHEFFTDSQLKRLPVESTDKVSLVELLQAGKEDPHWAPMCYATVVHMLMNQLEKPFFMVLDEFNCHFDNGQYFHMEYDEKVGKPIPATKVSLLQPALDALGISISSEDEMIQSRSTASIKKGGIMVGLTESKAVASRVTDALIQSARRAGADPDAAARMHVVDVPRYSILETDHIVSNMEAIGIGRLRFDRGDTVLNDQEVAYLRMVSGGAGQHLLDACII